MSQLVKRYFLLFTVLVGFSLLVNPLSVYAQSPTPIPLVLTDKLLLLDGNGGSVDVTSSYVSKMFALKMWPNQSLRDDFFSSFERARADGHWAVSVRENVSTTGAVSSFVELRWLESSCNVSLAYFNDHYRFLCNGSSHKWRRVSLYSNFIQYYTSDSFFLYSSSKLYSFNGDYTVDPSITWNIPTLPKGRYIFSDDDIPGWNDNCGLDVGCHLGNIATAVKSFFSFIIGIFDFSENNSLLKILKWLFIPKDASVWSFSSLSESFDRVFGSVVSLLDTLKKTYNAFVPPIAYWPSSAYCSTSPVGDAGNHNSAAHRYLFKSKVFGADFNPDICSFERAIGGYGNMSHIRTFTSVFLYAISLFLWYSFMLKVTGGRL